MTFAIKNKRSDSIVSSLDNEATNFLVGDTVNLEFFLNEMQHDYISNTIYFHHVHILPEGPLVSIPFMVTERKHAVRYALNGRHDNRLFQVILEANDMFWNDFYLFVVKGTIPSVDYREHFKTRRK